MEQVKITEDLLKDIKSGKTKIVVSPRIRRKYKDVDLNDVEAATSFISKNEDVVLIQRGHNLVIVSKSQFENMNKRTKRTDITKKKNTTKTIWDIEVELLKVFPEIKDVYTESKAKIDAAGCTGCSARAQANKVLKALADIHIKNPSRNIPEEIVKTLGPSFGRAVARDAYDKTPYGSIAVPVADTPARKLLEPVQHKHYTEGVRPSCLDCCRKHLGQSIVLLQESEFMG